MTTENAARIYKKVEQAQAKQQREKALKNSKAFVRLAKARGYNFTVKNLKTQLNQLSDEEIASIFNPGLGVRRHLVPR